MARLVRGCPTCWPTEGAGEPETNPSVPQHGGQRDAREFKAVADNDPDVDYEPEVSDPDVKAVDEDEENSDAKYAKMELPRARTLHQRMMNQKVANIIKRVHWAQVSEIMALWLQDTYL